MNKEKAGIFAFQLLAGLAYLVFAWSVTAAGERAHQFAIALGVDGDRLDLELDPFSLAEGETCSVTGDDGSVVLFSRRAGELILTTAQGRKVVLPDISDPGPTFAMLSGDDALMHFEIEAQSRGDEPEGLLILGGESLDEAGRDSIRKSLADSGVEKPVRFGGSGIRKLIIHHSAEGGEPQQARIIREERSASQRAR